MLIVFNKYNVIPELFIVTGAQFQFHEMSNKVIMLL
jgi:vitamin B12 transporter